MKKISFLIALIITICLSSFAQETIRGRVISESGQPLSGATILLKKAGRTSSSDASGEFAINGVYNNDSLYVTFIGYRSITVALSANDSKPLVVVLVSASRQLEEVSVSTGYYQVPPERSTGSFAFIDKETLNRVNTSDIFGRLKGVSPGILFDERNINEKISVRGISTLFAAQEPLIVLNNFPFEGNIRDINPNDVENITVLKDAAAASIWGVRAANGVIVVTTKKGRADQKPTVNFNSALSIGRQPDLNYNRGITSAEFIEVEKFLFDKGFYLGMEKDPARPPLTPAVEILIARRDGKMSASEADAQLAGLASQDVLQDFDRYFYDDSRSQQYSLSLNGGSDWNTYYVSAGYDRSLTYTSALNERLTLRADQVFSIGSKLKLRPGISFTTGKDAPGKPALGSITSGLTLQLYPYARFADEDGRSLPITKDYRTTYVTGIESSGLLNWQYRPLEDYQFERVNSTQNALILNMGADYEILPGLTAKLQYQFENRNSNREALDELDSYATRDLINRFTQTVSPGTLRFIVPRADILDLSSSSMSSHNGRGQLEYNKVKGIHSFDFVGGAEVREVLVEGNSYRTYGYSEDGLTSIPVNYLDQFPMFQNPGERRSVPMSNNFTNQIDRYTSLYSNAAYTFDNRYILSGSTRKDASNLFGVQSNQRGVPLWSVGAAWNIHNEEFFKAPWANQLKLRISYGYNGNLDRNLAAVATMYQVNGNFNSVPYGMIRTYPNPNLGWEKVQVFNAGLDFGLKNNRISGTVEYYIKNGQNLIGDQPVDPTVGVVSGTVRRNAANMLTRGLDLQINSLNIDRRLKWNSSLIFSMNSNELKKYHNEGTSSASAYIHGGRSIIPVVGKPVYSVFSYRSAGLDPNTGDPRGYVDGQTTSNYQAIFTGTSVDDLKFHGSALPTLYGAVANTISYKGFSLYLNLAYKFGYYFSRQSVSYSSLYSRWYGHADYTKRWQKPGDEQHTRVPSMVYPAVSARDEFYLYSSDVIEKGDNIRLQDLNLSYRFPTQGNKGFLNGMLLFTNVRNAGFIWRANKQGLDPDQLGTNLPLSYTLSFGLRKGF